MEQFAWICLGGALGTGARYLIAIWAAQRFGAAFPYGTLIVNLVGCFAITAVMHAALTLAWPTLLRSTLSVGFLGGLTTYSSFDYETTKLVQEGANGSAALNVALTVVGGLVAGWLGLIVARQLIGQ
jgi:CrcB protein